MSFNQFHKIVSPVYLNLIAVFLYYMFRTTGNFLYSDWNTYCFYLLLGIVPVLTFIWVFVRFRKIAKKQNSKNAFLTAMAPGFPIGVFIGYGLWEMAHGSEIQYLFLAIILYGVLASLITGFLGFCINFILRRK
ncbi:MAG: hypothetical protein B6242_16875 [Anaerolineaceae bacterium 4572_78]|nr:MAG: hypothetical protein B6242_16875 [Anaerolineaceae bacterium 4572_78]